MAMFGHIGDVNEQFSAAVIAYGATYKGGLLWKS